MMKYCTSRGGKRSSSAFMDAQQALDRGELVLRVEDLELARQPGLAVVRAQQAVAQAVEGADPHAARVHGEHRGEAREHLARRLVGEGHRQHAGGGNRARLEQPGDARGEDSRLAAARAGEDQRVPFGQRDGGELFGIEVFEVQRQGGSIIRPAQRRSTKQAQVNCRIPGSAPPPSRACAGFAGAFDLGLPTQARISFVVGG